MLDALSSALVECDRDPAVRVVVLTGAGRGFCSGLDLKDLAASGQGIGGGGPGGGSRQVRSAGRAADRAPPARQAHALRAERGGCGLRHGPRARLRHPRRRCPARSSPPAFTKRGVLPESGGTWLLPRLVGWSRACEIAFTGRTLNAQECLAAGLVITRVPLDELLAKEVARAGARDRRERAAGRSGDEADDAARAGRDLRGQRPPRVPPAAPALPEAGTSRRGSARSWSADRRSSRDADAEHVSRAGTRSAGLASARSLAGFEPRRHPLPTPTPRPAPSCRGIRTARAAAGGSSRSASR